MLERLLRVSALETGCGVEANWRTLRTCPQVTVSAANTTVRAYTDILIPGSVYCHRSVPFPFASAEAQHLDHGLHHLAVLVSICVRIPCRQSDVRSPQKR